MIFPCWSFKTASFIGLPLSGSKGLAIHNRLTWAGMSVHIEPCLLQNGRLPDPVPSALIAPIPADAGQSTDYANRGCIVKLVVQLREV